MTDRLLNKIAIITGAAQGIGFAIAKAFVSEGACVVLTDVQEERGRATTALLSERGAEVIFEPCDVTSAFSVGAMTEAVVKRLGPPDVLVNNAGIAVFCDPLAMTSADWQRCFSVDLEGVWNGCRAVLPHMLARLVLSGVAFPFDGRSRRIAFAPCAACCRRSWIC